MSDAVTEMLEKADVRYIVSAATGRIKNTIKYANVCIAFHGYDGVHPYRVTVHDRWSVPRVGMSRFEIAGVVFEYRGKYSRFGVKLKYPRGDALSYIIPKQFKPDHPMTLTIQTSDVAVFSNRKIFVRSNVNPMFLANQEFKDLCVRLYREARYGLKNNPLKREREEQEKRKTLKRN